LDDYFRTTPPLAKALADRLGGAQFLQNYTSEIEDLFSPLMREALALERLAARYPEGELDRLPDQTRTRVDAIGRDQFKAIRRDATAYLSLATEGLNYFRPSAPAPDASAGTACNSWTRAGAALAPALAGFHRQLELMFTIQMLKQPEELSRADLLQKAANFQARIGASLRNPCEP
jgi:hypothetical protein